MMNQYRCVALDPPWHEQGGGKIKRGADRHYGLMKTGAILALLREQIRPLIAADAHVWLWVTNNYLPDGLRALDALDVRYVTNLAWVKPSFGLGQYLRGQHELCLFGVRGRAMLPPRRDVPSVINAAKARHSEKPEAAFETFERVSPGPRLEVFARVKRAGWDAWGDEVEHNLFSTTL